MCMPDNTDLHFWLTRSVGRRIGLNFSHAIDAGRLSPDDYLGLVEACRACPHVARCQHWLGRPEATGGTAPAFCPNAAALEALKPH